MEHFWTDSLSDVVMADGFEAFLSLHLKWVMRSIERWLQRAQALQTVNRHALTEGTAHRDSSAGQLHDGQSRMSLEYSQAILVICDSVMFCIK